MSGRLPASVDRYLDGSFLTFANSRHSVSDIPNTAAGPAKPVQIPDPETFIPHPGEFILGSTTEHTELPADLVSRLEG